MAYWQSESVKPPRKVPWVQSSILSATTTIFPNDCRCEAWKAGETASEDQTKVPPASVSPTAANANGLHTKNPDRRRAPATKRMQARNPKPPDHCRYRHGDRNRVCSSPCEHAGSRRVDETLARLDVRRGGAG